VEGDNSAELAAYQGVHPEEAAMTSITVGSGETFRPHDQLTTADTVTIQAGGLLVVDQLEFIQPAGYVLPADIVVQPSAGGLPAGMLEIKNLPPVKDATLSFSNLVVHFTNAALPPLVLNTTGTSVFGDIHPSQQGTTGNFFFGAPLGGDFKFPPHVLSIPTNFVIG
jgi:hypothetical protein